MTRIGPEHVGRLVRIGKSGRTPEIIGVHGDWIWVEWPPTEFDDQRDFWRNGLYDQTRYECELIEEKSSTPTN